MNVQDTMNAFEIVISRIVTFLKSYRNFLVSLDLRFCFEIVTPDVYSKHPIFGLTQEWFRELSFSRLECGVHDKLPIFSADWWDILLPLA